MSRRVLGLAVLVIVLLGFLAGYFWLGPLYFGRHTHTSGTASSAVHGPGSLSSARTVYLSSLNGTVDCFEGKLFTRLVWLRMRDYNASNPAIQPYIAWLREALSPRPVKALNVPWYPRYRYWWINDGYGWSAELPPNNTVVRIGVVKLAYGAGIILTAYQVGDHIDVVIHGTIINPAEWRKTLPVIHALDLTTYSFRNATLRVEWVLWRIHWHNIYAASLITPHGRIPIRNIYALIEMPAYYLKVGNTWWYWAKVEYTLWDILGEPVLALAYHLLMVQNENYWDKYTTTITLTDKVVETSTGWGASLGGSTPFLLRTGGNGLCVNFADATATFESNTLGTVADVITTDKPSMGLHALSILMYPSRIFGTRGRIQTKVDIDFDKINDTGDKIADTASMSAYSIYRYQIYNTIEYPLLGVSVQACVSYWDEKTPFNFTGCLWLYRSYYYWMGIPGYVLGLPRVFQMPWLKTLYSVLRMDRFEGVAEHWLKWYIKWLAPFNTPTSLAEEFYRNVIEKYSNPVYYMPPGTALGVSKVLPRIPVIYSAPEPKMMLTINITGAGSHSSTSTAPSTSSSTTTTAPGTGNGSTGSTNNGGGGNGSSSSTTTPSPPPSSTGTVTPSPSPSPSPRPPGPLVLNLTGRPVFRLVNITLTNGTRTVNATVREQIGWLADTTVNGTRVYVFYNMQTGWLNITLNHTTRMLVYGGGAFKLVPANAVPKYLVAETTINNRKVELTMKLASWYPDINTTITVHTNYTGTHTVILPNYTAAEIQIQHLGNTSLITIKITGLTLANYTLTQTPQTQYPAKIQLLIGKTIEARITITILPQDKTPITITIPQLNLTIKITR